MGSDQREGVSFRDVREAWSWMERTHNGHVAVHIHPYRGQAQGVLLTVRVVLVRGVFGQPGYSERGASGAWPSKDSKTFAGLLLSLAYQLDRLLTDELSLAQRRDMFAEGDK
jgi:hypothetical protein